MVCADFSFELWKVFIQKGYREVSAIRGRGVGQQYSEEVGFLMQLFSCTFRGMSPFNPVYESRVVTKQAAGYLFDTQECDPPKLYITCDLYCLLLLTMKGSLRRISMLLGKK